MIAPPHDALLWQHEKKKKNHAAENFFPPPGKRKQLSEIWSFGSHVCKKPHDWFCFYTFFFFFFFFVSRTATFEPFVNLRCATWDSRQLPFADNYEHFIFPQSPGGVRAQFAFQNSSPCLTWAASLFFLSVAHPAAPLSSRPGSIPEDVRDFDERSVRSDLAVTVRLWAFSGLQKDV